MHLDLPVAADQVQAAEVVPSSKHIEAVIDAGECVNVHSRGLVELVVVSVLFLD